MRRSTNLNSQPEGVGFKKDVHAARSTPFEAEPSFGCDDPHGSLPYARRELAIQDQFDHMLMTQGAPPAEEALLLPSIVQPATAGGSNQGYVVELDSGDEADFKPRNGVKRRIAADYGHDASQAVLHEAIAWRIAREFGHPFDTLVAPCVLRAIDGIDPTSPGGGPSWRDFLRAHAGSIVACDFFTVESVCLRRSYALFFIAHANRRVWPAGCTTNPTGAWVTQQARNLGFEKRRAFAGLSKWS
jgi:hypothetical protein